MKLLVLRPRPGAERTAARARALGLETVIAPLFLLRALEWRAPDPAGLEAVMLTSANAVRLAGPKLASFSHMPCFAVGETSAAAAVEAGFRDVRIGTADGAALVELIAGQGVRHVFHPRGRDHVRLSHPLVGIVARDVYAAEEVETLPREAAAALAQGALVLIHSPRAGALFARLVRDRGEVAIAAISAAATEAAGGGWRSVAVAVAARPRDSALLELAAKLCNTKGPEAG